MIVTVKHWLSQNPAAPDIRSYRTTVTVATDAVTCAVTFGGKLKRKQAIEQTWRHLTQEQRWSPDFLRKLWDHC